MPARRPWPNPGRRVSRIFAVIVPLFVGLTWVHIFFGSIGLVLFWIPVITKKGKRLHRQVGTWFCYSMLATGTVATFISFISLAYPLETHPLFDDPRIVRAQFGWLMLYLAALTMSLAWFGLVSVRYKKEHRRHRDPINLGLQLLVIATGVNCSIQGWLIDKTLLMWIGMVGFVSASAILAFTALPNPGKAQYLHFHVRASVGAGISAYTAVLAVTLVRTMPEDAFNPVIWAIPTIVGSTIIGYHEARLFMQRYLPRFRAARRAAKAKG